MKSHEDYKSSIDKKAERILQHRKRRRRYMVIASSFTVSLILIICAATIIPDFIKKTDFLANPDSNYSQVENPTDSSTHDTKYTESSSSKSSTSTTNHSSTTNTSSSYPHFETATINVITNFSAANRLCYDPKKTYKETWTWDKITAYLGKDITPAYIMDGLKRNSALNEQTVIFHNDGTLAYDALWLEYYTEYYEDGSQCIGFNSTGIRIIASKLGYAQDCIYVWPSDMKLTIINGVSVKFGYRKMPVGGTAEKPESYYDMFVAEFINDTISYQIVSSNISEDEFVKMVVSMIS